MALSCIHRGAFQANQLESPRPTKRPPLLPRPLITGRRAAPASNERFNLALLSVARVSKRMLDYVI